MEAGVGVTDTATVEAYLEEGRVAGVGVAGVVGACTAVVCQMIPGVFIADAGLVHADLVVLDFTGGADVDAGSVCANLSCLAELPVGPLVAGA